MFQLRPVLALVLVLAACGEVLPSGPPDAGSDAGVDGETDLCPTMSCDDGDACTVDSCRANACVHEAVHGQQTFMPTGTIQMFVPDRCMRALTIDAHGAQGGGSMLNNQPGGRGARVKGDFAVAEGTLLLVLVGSAGGTAMRVGGGGGGTFVWDAASTGRPLIAAGGGGGAGLGMPGLPGLVTESGGHGGAATRGGGTNGSGGVLPQPLTNWAAGGGGWVSDGAGGGGPLTEPCGQPAVGGRAPRNGGAGGAPGGTVLTATGGFGGGGGGQGQCNVTGGGGGGGYSGGGGGIDNGAPNFTPGGGGGSFNGGMNQTNEEGVKTGPGSVTISW